MQHPPQETKFHQFFVFFFRGSWCFFFSSPKLCYLKRNPQKRIYKCTVQVAHSMYAVRSSCFCLAVLTERKKLDVCSVLIHIHSQTTLDASRIFYTHHYHSSSVVFRLPPLVPGGLNATRQKREKKGICLLIKGHSFVLQMDLLPQLWSHAQKTPAILERRSS